MENLYEFESDPVKLIENYMRENNTNYNTLAQVIIGAVHVEYFVFKILEVSPRTETPLKSGFARNIEALSEIEVIDDEQKTTLEYIKNTRNRFAHEINARLEDPMSYFTDAVLRSLIHLVQMFVLERRSVDECS